MRFLGHAVAHDCQQNIVHEDRLAGVGARHQHAQYIGDLGQHLQERLAEGGGVAVGEDHAVGFVVKKLLALAPHHEHRLFRGAHDRAQGAQLRRGARIRAE